METQHRTVSVVMCTFNGEKYLKEQLDSILRQTYPILELIVQDDCSTDNTYSIVEEYAQKHPFIKLFRNEKQLGVNQNFFSAMQRSKGELIAISDQDDIWEDNKLEIQVAAIGDKMCCAGKSAHFSSENVSFTVDMRAANHTLLRQLFVGTFSGHNMLITRQLLDETIHLSDFYPFRMYDSILAIVATAHNSAVFVESVLVRHRRHLNNSTKTYFNPTGNQKTLKNLFNTAKESWYLYRKLRPQILRIIRSEEKFLSEIHSQEPVLQESIKMLHWYSSRYFIDFLRLSIFCARRGNLLTFAQGKQSFSTCLLGTFFPIYSAGYFRFLL